MTTHIIWILLSFSGDYISTQPVAIVPVAQFATQEACEALRAQVRRPPSAKLECFKAEIVK